MIERRIKIYANSSYGGVFVYNLSSQLLEQYPFEVTAVQKGRGTYICTTSEGGKIIIGPFRGSKGRAEALEHILLRLKENGIEADEIVHTREREILVQEVDETWYYARKYIEGRECETRSRDDVLAAVGELAKLHLALQEVQDENLKTGGQDYAMEVFRHNRELKKVRNYIHGKHKKNEFEMIFMRNYETFLTQALDVERRLMKKNQSEPQKQEAAVYGICHGEFNQHNVLFARGKIIITNFEQAHYDVLVGDLAHFLRKLMEKHNFNIGLATDMLAAYEKKRKLMPEEWEQLYVRMAYPQKFWKVANHYFNANKAWVSGRDIEKLNRVIEQEEIRQQFLRMLFYFVQ